MNRASRIALVVFGLLLPVPVQAQQPTVAETQATALENAARGQAAERSLARRLAERQESLPETVSVKPEIRAKLAATRVSLTLDAENSEEALQQLLEATKYSYIYDPAFYRTTLSLSAPTGQQSGAKTLDLPPRSITMKLLNATVPNALDSLTQSIGIGWTATEEDGNITIRIVKLRTTMTMFDAAGRLYGSVQGNAVYAPAIAGLTTASGGNVTSLFFSRALPNVRVSLDSKNWSVREALKQVLQEAKMDFAIDSDVAEDLKRNMGFEKIQLATALDVICQSSDIGWRTENTGKGVLVRVSKRYAPSTEPVKGTAVNN